MVDGVHLRVGGQPTHSRGPNVDGRKNMDIPKAFYCCGLLFCVVSSYFSAPKAGLDSIKVGASVDFGAMWNFEEWDKGDAIHGLENTLTNSIWGELTALQGHSQARLSSHPEAQDL